jgi:chemotaxis protein MotB
MICYGFLSRLCLNQKDDAMTIHPHNTLRGCALFALIAAMGLTPAWADDLDTIRYGEAARTYAAGSIQTFTPQDGVVNVITGDNQTVGNRMRLGQNDVFYLKLKDPSEVAVGDLFTVYKRTRKVFHPATGQYMGYLITRLAIVRVVQVDRELTTAHAIRAYAPAAPGDPVVRFSLPSSDEAAVVPASGDISGMVVDIQADLQMTLVAQRNVVYLDRGWEDGLRAGDRMELTRYGGGLPPRQVGEVKVLSTEGRSATALVTKSTSRILKGDQFRTKYQADAIPPARPAKPSMNTAPNRPSNKNDKRAVQNASRETRYNLSDLMKMLHYESGEARIKPEGYQTLDQMVELLKASPAEQLIRVEGHADSMEIGPSLKSLYPTNWDLSKARATGVLRYLVEKGGIDSARISSVGYGATKPVMSNATEDGRSKNRRVEVVLYPPDAPPAPEEPAAAPVEAADDGYRVSGLESGSQEPAVPSVDPNSVPSESSQAEKPVETPSVTSETLPEAGPSVSSPPEKTAQP